MLKIDPTLNELENFMALVNSAARSTQYTPYDLSFGLPQPYTATAQDQHQPNTIIAITGKGGYVGETQLRYKRLDLSATTTNEAETQFVFNDHEESVGQFLQRLATSLGLCRIGVAGWPGVEVQMQTIDAPNSGTITFTPARGANNYLFTGSRTIEVLVVNGQLKASDFVSA